MTIKFPRGVVVDLDHIPDNFDDLIRESFAGYTECTAAAYTYQDKLSYIDLCRRYLHRANDTSDCVLALMQDLLRSVVTKDGEVPDKDDYLSVEFMEMCYDAGRTELYDHYTGDHHIDDKIMALLVRTIAVVINYNAQGGGDA